jgi:hypothetical protein
MSIIVNGNLIKITKPNGSEMFNSNNKLVHRKFSATGSATLGGANSQTSAILLNVQFNRNKDVPLVYVTPTASGGNVAAQYLNATIQLNFAMLTHFTHSTTQALITAYDQLASGVTISAQGKPVLNFTTIGYGAGSGGDVQTKPFHKNSSVSISFDWKFVLLTYQ